jgi:hypothetical protein
LWDVSDAELLEAAMEFRRGLEQAMTADADTLGSSHPAIR